MAVVPLFVRHFQPKDCVVAWCMAMNHVQPMSLLVSPEIQLTGGLSQPANAEAQPD